ncbi:MAG TPA: metal-sulfur cluster assembly factor [Streptosporangiaceae bacterium]|nr:metal-sulfur cluster assembly factor [Streptosporangiaceae bacterium]
MSTPAGVPGAPGGAPSPDDPVNAAWNALAGISDPELYLDVVSLGLVYDVRVDGGVLVVEMTMTTPGCPVSESLPEEARAAVRQAAGDSLPVDLRVVWDPPWDPSMMDDTAASALGFRIM